MAQFINRKVALSHPFANGHYDHENANEEFIFGYESYREWLEDLPYIDMNKWSDVLPVGANRWIPVSERLPKDGEYVLVTGSMGLVLTAFYHPEYWIDGAGFRMKDPPLAWMPLPEPYSEEKKT